MAFPNVSDIAATTIESRSGEIADNVTKNNAFLAWLKESGNERKFSGGSVIYEELSFSANGNAGWYSGYDLLPTAAQDVISAAQFNIAQAACPVTISGLEQLKNMGKQEIIDLMAARMRVAEASMMNLLAAGVYSDGTAAGGKQIVGLDAAVPVSPGTGIYGGIDRAAWPFWRSLVSNPGVISATNIQGYMDTMWANLVRGADRPNLILMDTQMWSIYLQSLQALQRFTQAEKGKLGFPSIAFMDASVVLDGGIGGFATAKTAYFLNTKYLYWRPHSSRNMVPLNPNRRYAVNQDAEVAIIAWAGNITSAGPQFQGRLISS
ncbi:MAG TPA: phage major capsid protein [Anaerolineales bacterium]